MSPTETSPHAATEALSGQAMEFPDFLAKLSSKDRASAERRVVVLESSADAALAGLWRRLACSLLNLAPFAAKLGARQVVMYFIADGKYRMQVFALEELEGSVRVYCPDVLAHALDRGVLVATNAQRTANVYGIVGSSDVLEVDTLDRTTIDPALHFKDMVGWNRKALCITLPPAASAGQIAATEQLCALAAGNFPKSAANASPLAPSRPTGSKPSPVVVPRSGA